MTNLSWSSLIVETLTREAAGLGVIDSLTWGGVPSLHGNSSGGHIHPCCV